MASAWTSRRIADVAEIYDGPHATPHKTIDGPWFLSISSLREGRLDLAESAHLSEADFILWTRRVTPEPGDVLFSYETRLGEAALMPDGLRACLGRRMGLLRPRRDIVNPRFLLYAYLGPEFQATIERRTIRGATVDRIPLNDLENWSIRVPDRTTQDAVAEVLGALDDKIESNVALSHKSSELAAARFLEVASQSRVRLADVAAITMGQSPPGRTYNDTGDGLPFYQGTRDFGFRHPRLRIWCTAPTRLAKPRDILVSVRAPVGTLNVARDVCAIGRGIAAVSSADFPSVLYQALAADPSVWDPYEAEGTVFGSINKQQLATIRISWPHSASIGPLETALAALDARLGAAETESQLLASLRDTLLPRLLSGEIRVREAEELVGEAV